MTRISRRWVLAGGGAALAVLLAGERLPARADEEQPLPRFIMFHVEAGW